MITPTHLEAIRKLAESLDDNEELALSKAEAIAILDALDYVTGTLKDVGFVLDEDPQPFDVEKAQLITMTALQRLGHTP